MKTFSRAREGFPSFKRSQLTGLLSSVCKIMPLNR